MTCFRLERRFLLLACSASEGIQIITFYFLLYMSRKTKAAIRASEPKTISEGNINKSLLSRAWDIIAIELISFVFKIDRWWKGIL